MKKIFINYRRDDTRDDAKRIYDSLVKDKEFTSELIFRDLDSLPLGADLREIETQIIRSDVLLAVIGPTWLDCEKDGERRLFAREDWVREEIEIGLEIWIHVIPVLVGGAQIPRDKKLLPPTIQELANKNRAELRDGSEFDGDMVRLINKLRNIPSPIPNRLTREKVREIIDSARSQGKKPDLRNKNLVNIDLNGEDLSEVDFTNANLSFANLKGLPNLESTILQEANLYKAKLYRAHMKEANLRKAHLYKTELLYPTLTGADLSEVDLKNTNVKFKNAHLEGVRLFGTDLSSLDKLDLEKAILIGAEASADTTLWPDGFDPKAAGVILK